jgi:dTMP kinase
VSQGLFLVLEGIDGSGTTTQAELLRERLTALGQRVVLTREPTRGPVGRFLRQALGGKLEEEGQPVQLGWDSMALLFAADRMDHLNREVLPALAMGAIVISDRYDLSSVIYQSATCPEGERAIPWLVTLNERARRPDLTLVLDIDPDAAALRREARGEEAEIYERADLQRKLRDLYKRASELLPSDPIALLSGEGTREEVANRIFATLSGHPEFGRFGSPGR